MTILEAAALLVRFEEAAHERRATRTADTVIRDMASRRFNEVRKEVMDAMLVGTPQPQDNFRSTKS